MDKTKQLLTIEDILPYLKFIRNKRQEYTICLSLDSGHRLIARRIVTSGTLTASIIHPREVFAGPLKDRAASIIIAHNHPSGDPTPSKTDIKTTQQFVAAGILLGVPVRDHIVVAKGGYYSFRKAHLI
jgi:DNA repair protein RadC